MTPKDFEAFLLDILAVDSKNHMMILNLTWVIALTQYFKLNNKIQLNSVWYSFMKT